MKSRKETILGKRLVQGDPNLVTKDEILVKEKDNKVYMYQRNNWGRLVSVSHQYPQKEKDYMEVYMAKVKSQDLDIEFWPDIKRFHTVFTINIKVPLKYNTRETKYFIFFLPYYKCIETDAVRWTINVEAQNKDVDKGSYKQTGDIHQINLSGLDFLHTIIGGDLGGCNLDPSCHINKEDIKKSTRLCGLVAITYESGEQGELINLNAELLPAFNQKKEVQVRTGKYPDEIILLYSWAQKFKILNVDKQIRTFYTLPFRKDSPRDGSPTDEFYDENRGLVRLADPYQSIYKHKKRRCNYVNREFGYIIPAYKEYAINRFTGQSFILDTGRRDEQHFLPFSNDGTLRRYIKVLR